MSATLEILIVMLVDMIHVVFSSHIVMHLLYLFKCYNINIIGNNFHSKYYYYQINYLLSGI